MSSSSSDLEGGFRSLQYSSIAAAACGFCGYFAAKQLSAPWVEESTRQNRAMLIGGLGFALVAAATVYSAFVVYRASMRTKMFAVMALLISLGGGYGAWTLGWNRGGNPDTMKAL